MVRLKGPTAVEERTWGSYLAGTGSPIWRGRGSALKLTISGGRAKGVKPTLFTFLRRFGGGDRELGGEAALERRRVGAPFGGSDFTTEATEKEDALCG